MLDALTGVGRGVKDFFVDAPNRRGEAMADAERARNEAMMRENGLMANDGTVAPETNPELFQNPIPGAGTMADFIRRLQATHNK